MYIITIKLISPKRNYVMCIAKYHIDISSMKTEFSNTVVQKGRVLLSIEKYYVIKENFFTASIQHFCRNRIEKYQALPITLSIKLLHFFSFLLIAMLDNFCSTSFFLQIAMLGNGREEFRFAIKNGEASRVKNPFGTPITR